MFVIFAVMRMGELKMLCSSVMKTSRDTASNIDCHICCSDCNKVMTGSRLIGLRYIIYKTSLTNCEQENRSKVWI